MKLQEFKSVIVSNVTERDGGVLSIGFSGGQLTIGPLEIKEAMNVVALLEGKAASLAPVPAQAAPAVAAPAKAKGTSSVSTARTKVKGALVTEAEEDAEEEPAPPPKPKAKPPVAAPVKAKSKPIEEEEPYADPEADGAEEEDPAEEGEAEDDAQGEEPKFDPNAEELPSELVGAKRLRDIVTYMMDRGVQSREMIEQHLIAMKSRIPLLAKRENIKESLRVVFDVIAQSGE